MEYEQAVASLFLSLNDGHTTYNLPSCYMAFTVQQPFDLVSYVDENKRQVIAVGSVDQNVAAELQSRFGISNLSQYVGATVDYIDLDTAFDEMRRYAEVATGF